MIKLLECRDKEGLAEQKRRPIRVGLSDGSHDSSSLRIDLTRGAEECLQPPTHFASWSPRELAGFMTASSLDVIKSSELALHLLTFSTREHP